MNQQPARRLSNEEQAVANLSGFLQTRKEALAAVLPKHLTPERVVKIACAAVSRSPLLRRCTVASLYMGINQASQLGLEIDLAGQAYLVPFKNGRTGQFEAVFIPGYRGLIDLARRSRDILRIESRVVYEQDKFSYKYGTDPAVEHFPYPGTDRGAKTHVYAVAFFRDGGYQFEVMNAEEVEKVKSSSKAADKGPWKTWEDEMWRKCPVRRLFKYLPMSTEARQALQIEDAAEAGVRPVVGLPGDDLFSSIESQPIAPEEEGGMTSKAQSIRDKLGAKKAAKTEPSATPSENKPAGGSAKRKRSKSTEETSKPSEPPESEIEDETHQPESIEEAEPPPEEPEDEGGPAEDEEAEEGFGAELAYRIHVSGAFNTFKESLEELGFRFGIKEGHGRCYVKEVSEAALENLLTYLTDLKFKEEDRVTAVKSGMLYVKAYDLETGEEVFTSKGG